jgi:hypothetical protein
LVHWSRFAAACAAEAGAAGNTATSNARAEALTIHGRTRTRINRPTLTSTSRSSNLNHPLSWTLLGSRATDTISSLYSCSGQCERHPVSPVVTISAAPATADRLVRRPHRMGCWDVPQWDTCPRPAPKRGGSAAYVFAWERDTRSMSDLMPCQFATTMPDVKASQPRPGHASNKELRSAGLPLLLLFCRRRRGLLQGRILLCRSAASVAAPGRLGPLPADPPHCAHPHGCNGPKRD